MHITVDAAGTVGLDEAADFKAFDLRVDGGSRTLALEALGDDASEAPEADHMFVSVERVRALARLVLGDEADETWEQNYQGMLGYAGSKGWMSDDNAFVKAHLVSID